MAGVWRWRLDVLDDDLSFLGKAHRELNEVRDGPKLHGELSDADRNGR
jgi:hypothetical protein